MRPRALSDALAAAERDVLRARAAFTEMKAKGHQAAISAAQRLLTARERFRDAVQRQVAEGAGQPHAAARPTSSTASRP